MMKNFYRTAIISNVRSRPYLPDSNKPKTLQKLSRKMWQSAPTRAEKQTPHAELANAARGACNFHTRGLPTPQAKFSRKVR